MSYLAKSVPRTGLEPARLSARAPETRASTIPPPGHRLRKNAYVMGHFALGDAKVERIFGMCNLLV